MKQCRPHQEGNVVLFILLGVALFAALAYTFMRGSQQGTSSMSKQQAKIAAQEILDYARTVERGVNKLRSKGCSESQLSFEHSGVSTPGDLVNPNAPGTFECHLFKTEGAGITPLAPKENWFPANYGADIVWYTSSESYTDIGTTCAQTKCADLALNIWNIKSEICSAINEQLGYNFTTIPADPSTHCWGQFKGTFDCGGGNPSVRFNQANLKGKTSICFKDPSYGYVFNHILLAR